MYSTYYQLQKYYEQDDDPTTDSGTVLEKAKYDAANIPLEVARLRDAHDTLVQSGMTFTDEEEKNFNDYCDYLRWEAKQAYYYSLAHQPDYQDVVEKTKESAKNDGYNTLAKALASETDDAFWQNFGGEITKTLGISSQDTSYDELGDKVTQVGLFGPHSRVRRAVKQELARRNQGAQFCVDLVDSFPSEGGNRLVLAFV